jgi:acyl-CoA reductase-like NAD-dependent aldehyde dehydrogenase
MANQYTKRVGISKASLIHLTSSLLRQLHCMVCLRFYHLLRINSGDHHDLGSASQRFAYVRREPLGVCAGIGAWNYPFQVKMNHYAII